MTELAGVSSKDVKEQATAGGAAGLANKLKKGEVARALVVRTRQAVRRLDGTFVKLSLSCLFLSFFPSSSSSSSSSSS